MTWSLFNYINSYCLIMCPSPTELPNYPRRRNHFWPFSVSLAWWEACPPSSPRQAVFLLAEVESTSNPLVLHRIVLLSCFFIGFEVWRWSDEWVQLKYRFKHLRILGTQWLKILKSLDDLGILLPSILEFEIAALHGQLTLRLESRFEFSFDFFTVILLL